MLLWPMVAVLGFVALAGVVIALGRSSTARYEFERNAVHGPRQQAPAATRTEAPGRPATRSVGEVTREPGHGRAPAGPRPQEQRSAVGVAAHPAGKRAVEHGSSAAWWLVDESDDRSGGRVVAGPFPDRIDADWAALSSGLSATARAVHGVHRADGGFVRRQSPQEAAWLADLSDQLDRLAEDWDELLTDTDALTTLVVEVAAALVEAGLPLHDCAGRGPARSGPGGGVCLTPDPGRGGILVSWRQHDRMSLQQVRGAAVDEAVQRTMNAAVADVLAQIGFGVTPFGSTGCHLVTVARPGPWA